MRLTSVTPIPLVCTVAFVAAACTGSTARLSPTAPSPAAAITVEGSSDTTVTASATAEDVIDRTGGTLVRDPEQIARWAAENWTFDVASDLQVEGSGPIDSVTGSCPSVTLSIYGVPVMVSATTSYPIGSSCAGLGPGRVVRVRGMLFVSNGQAQVLATYLTIEGGINRPVEGEGVVTALAGACPSLVVTVRGVTVQLGAGTVVRWRSGATAACEDILVGMVLHISAEITPSNALIASRVTIQSGGTEPTTVSGTVSARNGECPSLTLVVGSSPVRTNSSTLFIDGTCSQVTNGARVEATGTRNAEGTLVATRLRIREAGSHEPTTVTGTVSERSGSCPNLTMHVGSTDVKTTSSTSFVNGSCSDVQNGARVEATGTRDSRGRLVASRVKILEGPNNGEHVEGSGVVGTVSGSCPSLTFTAFGQTIRTSGNTQFRAGSCRDIRTGARVFVRAIRETGYIRATLVDVNE